MSLPNVTFRPELPPTVRQEFGQFAALVQGFVSTEHRADGSHDHITARSFATDGPVRWSTQGLYLPSTTDTNAFGAAGPAYAFYRLKPSADATINGISVGATIGTRGHVVECVNESAFAITFGAASVLGPRRILSDVLTIGPEGRVQLVYDISGGGWRVTAAHPGTMIAYTPAWTGSVSNPAIGNGSIVGSWQQLGATVTYTIVIVMGSSTTYGSGTYSFSLPSSQANNGAVHGSVLLFESGVATLLGVALYQTATTVNVFNHGNAASGITPTVPFTFGTSDAIRITGTYVRL
jgi:hypothetical protein